MNKEKCIVVKTKTLPQSLANSSKLVINALTRCADVNTAIEEVLMPVFPWVQLDKLLWLFPWFFALPLLLAYFIAYLFSTFVPVPVTTSVQHARKKTHRFLNCQWAWRWTYTYVCACLCVHACVCVCVCVCTHSRTSAKHIIRVAWKRWHELW